MSRSVSGFLLWLFVINLGIALGAGLYEHRIAIPEWLVTSGASGPHWNADAVSRFDTGRRFWAFVTTGPLTLVTLANLFGAWRSSGVIRGYWLGAAIAALADRVFAFAYFIPTMVGLMGSPDSPASIATATAWSNLNYLRHLIVFAAYLLALKTFALFHQNGVATR
jgi:hypothetical protein